MEKQIAKLKERVERLIEINDERKNRIKNLNDTITKLKSQRAVHKEQLESLESDVEEIESTVKENNNWITYVTGAGAAIGTAVFYLLQLILF